MLHSINNFEDAKTEGHGIVKILPESFEDLFGQVGAS